MLVCTDRIYTPKSNIVVYRYMYTYFIILVWSRLRLSRYYIYIQEATDTSYTYTVWTTWKRVFMFMYNPNVCKSTYRYENRNVRACSICKCSYVGGVTSLMIYPTASSLLLEWKGESERASWSHFGISDTIDQSERDGDEKEEIVSGYRCQKILWRSLRRKTRGRVTWTEDTRVSRV